MDSGTYNRLRWRLRGAWLWPSFLVLTVAEALMLHVLPIAGLGTGIVPGLLVATFFNLLGVAVLGRLAGRILRWQFGSLPRVVADDYGGTVVLILVGVVLLLAGLVHQPERQAAKRERGLVLAAADAHFATHRSVPAGARIDLLVLGGGLYRACAGSSHARLARCVLVRTEGGEPTRLREDHERTPNARYARGR